MMHLGQKVTFRVFDSFYENNFDPKYTGDDRSNRIRRSKIQMFKGFYFLFAITLGWYTAKDSHFLPPVLGGRGSTTRTFDDFPYQDESEYPHVRTAILV
mmetsp:Transcript_2359/g.290  ORF Transcript_2359/g.290 Transcript_2359/m.290 type:complete len:99 (+) Transcript_2359:27-323(+)